MGGRGTGKSSVWWSLDSRYSRLPSYVLQVHQRLLGKDVTDVGHGPGLELQISDIKEYDFLMKTGHHVTLVDTPGFNDYTADAGGKSDLVILKEIGAFLKAK